MPSGIHLFCTWWYSNYIFFKILNNSFVIVTSSANHIISLLQTLYAEFSQELLKFGDKGFWNMRVYQGHGFHDFNCKLLSSKKDQAKFGPSWKNLCQANQLKKDATCLFTIASAQNRLSELNYLAFFFLPSLFFLGARSTIAMIISPKVWGCKQFDTILSNIFYIHKSI